jgi:hypothetical protein
MTGCMDNFFMSVRSVVKILFQFIWDWEMCLSSGFTFSHEKHEMHKKKTTANGAKDAQ